MSRNIEQPEEVRQWLARHPVMQWPEDLSFDDQGVWDAVRAHQGGPRHRHRADGLWAGAAVALALALMLAWVHLTAPAPRLPHPRSVAAQRPLKPVQLGTVASAAMAGANGGWVLTTTRQVLRTTTGGQHWQSVTPKGLTSFSASDSLQLAARGPNRAWLAVDTPHQAVMVYRTTDGGAHWSSTRVAPIAFGGGGVQMDWVSALNGWLEVLTAGNASPSAVLYSTTNGGASWERLTTSTSSASGHLPFGGIITFQTAQSGWVVGSPRAAGQVPWRYYIAHSRDGGRIWHRVRLPEPPGLPVPASLGIDILPPVVAPGGSALLPVMDSETHGATALVLYAAGPHGTWTVRSELKVPAAGALRGPNQPQVAFSSSRDGWAAINGRLYATIDGGRHWRLVLRSPAITAWAALQFPTATDGWVLDARGHLWDTVNGGRAFGQASR